MVKVACMMKNRNLIVTVSGEIDHHTAEDIREKIDREYSRSNAKNIIFDFSGIQFMDSSGIGMIMGRFKNIENQGGKMAIVHVTPSVDRIFQLSGLYKIIRSYGNMEEAVQSL